MLRHDSERIVSAAEDLSDSASGDLFSAWAMGVVVALPLAIYGIWCIVTRTAHFPRLGVQGGPKGLAMGIAYLSAGLFLNFHYFWSWRSRYYGYAQIGKAIAMLGVAGGLCYFVFRVLAFG